MLQWILQSASSLLDPMVKNRPGELGLGLSLSFIIWSGCLVVGIEWYSATANAEQLIPLLASYLTRRPRAIAELTMNKPCHTDLPAPKLPIRSIEHWMNANPFNSLVLNGKTPPSNLTQAMRTSCLQSTRQGCRLLWHRKVRKHELKRLAPSASVRLLI
jgi:hypothetical protein